MPDIFDEVADDLRAERTQHVLRRYGGWLIGLFVLIVAGAGGWQLWTRHQASVSAAQAEQFLAAEKIADGQLAGRSEALPGFAAVAQTAGPGYRTLARLREAAIKADAHDLPGALALWDDVAHDSAADPILRDFASLQWGLRQIDSGDPAAIRQRLQPLTGPGGVWRALAQEGLAMVALREGKPDEARGILKQLSTDTLAPDGVRGRANGLLQRLGS